MIRRRRKPGIVIGFTEHTLKEVSRLRRQYEKSDVILTERASSEVDNVKSGGNKYTAIKTGFPKFVEAHDKLLKDMVAKGKIIEGLNMPISGGLLTKDKITPRMRNYLEISNSINVVLKEIGNTPDGKIKANLLITESQLRSELDKIREEEALIWISKNINKLKGKRVFIDIGLGHSYFRQMLVKKLRQLGVDIPVEGKVLSRKGPTKGTQPLLQPINRMILIHRVMENAAPEKRTIFEKRLKELANDEIRFDKIYWEIERRLISEGVPKEEAQVMAVNTALREYRKGNKK
jgi:hypothetical protein